LGWISLLGDAMSAINDGGPAFPRDHRYEGHNGMTLRDYFAAKAMQGFAADGAFARDNGLTIDELAEDAYDVADAMLKAREA
jgi:hypothetical protein